MLQHIHIENLAVIEEADISFDSGLNVLTGETGAGKSIVIDALNMVLGERSSRDLVRTGCDKAEVTALFAGLSVPVLTALTEMGYDCSDGQLLCRRRVTAEGKSTAYINGAPVTVALLRQIGRLLVNIHGQHDNQALLSEDKQRDYLDAIGGLATLKETYLAAYHRYGVIARRLKKLRIDEQEKAQRMDTLRFQIQEIEQLDPHPGEEEELGERRAQMRHAEKIMGSLQRATWALQGDDQNAGAMTAVQQAADALIDAAEFLPTLQPLADKLQAMRYDLEEAAADVEQTAGQMSFDAGEKEQVESRLSTLRRLLGKYGPGVEEMLAHLDKARAELQDLESRDQTIADDERALALAEQETVTAAEALTVARRQTADRFAAEVMQQLAFLDMPGTVLDIAIEPTTLTASGGDKITFLLAANAGEEAKPPARAASGGELARIMLAIKSVMAGADDIDTLVFDEVDTGISGHAARKVGIKLKETAAARQVLCVTHLAQIAAAADRQLLVRKEVQNDRTRTRVETLTGEARERELARIISGEVTPAGMAAARDLLVRVEQDTARQ